MKREEKRRPQASGHERVVCRKCGWVYPNPHPSAKQRRAHRKHCWTAGGDGGAVTAGGGGAGGGEGKKASDEEFSDEDRRKNSEEAVGGDLKLGVEEAKEVKSGVGSGGEVGNSDNTLEPYVLLHGSQVHGPCTECSANQLDSDRQFRDHTLSCDNVSCNVNMDSASNHAENSDSSILFKTFMVSYEDKQDFACAESKVNSTMLVNDTELEYYAKNDSDEDMPVFPTLLGNPASDSSVIDSQLQKMDECVELNDPLDDATVNTLMKVYPDEVSANIKEARSFACNTQDEQTNKEGQLSQNELLSKVGSFLIKNFDDEYLNSTAYCDQSECQKGMPDKWKMNGNALENVNALQMPSSTSQGEFLKETLGFYEDHGSVELNVTIRSVGAEAGNELNYHVGDVASEIVPMVELDNIANGILSAIQVHQSNPPTEEIVSINAVIKLNANLSHKDDHVDGDRSTLVTDSEHEAGVSLPKSEGSEGLRSDGLETHPCVTTAGTSGTHATILDDQVTGSHETCSASIQLGEFKTEFQSEEQSDPSHELLLCDPMVATEVGSFAASNVSEADEPTKISNESQLVINEAMEVNIHYSYVEIKQEIYEEESCHSTKTKPQLKCDTVEPELLPDEYIGENEVEKSKDLSAPTLFDNGLDLQHTEKNSRHLENITEDHSDQLEDQNFLQIRSTENTVGDDTDELSDPSHELLLCDPMVATEVSSFAASEVSEADEPTKISNESQLVINEAMEVNNNYSSVEFKQEIYEEESCHSTKTNPQLKCDTVEPELLPDEYIGENEVEKSKGLSTPTLFNNGLDLQHNENNSRHLENITEDHSDQLEDQKVLQIRSTENTVDDDADDPDMKMKHMNTENNLMEELHQLNDLKAQTEYVDNIPGSQLEPQNGFQDNSKDSSVGNDNNYSIPEIGLQIPHIQTENGLAKPSSEDQDCKEKNSDAQDFMIEGQVTSSPLVESIKNIITCNDSEMNEISIVASDLCYQPLKEEHANFEPKQHPDSYIWDTVISADSNCQIDNIEWLRGYVSDGTVPSIRHQTDSGSILDPQTQTPKDLCSSNVAKGCALPESSAADCVTFEEPPFMTHVKPGRPMRPSVSYEIQSIQNSQDESEARKKNEDVTAEFARGNSRKVHVPLKILLAEANFENQQVTNAQEHYKSMQDKTSQTSQDEGCTGRTWSSKIASEKPTKPSLNREEYKEWNSPARLPANKNQKRREKGKQPWMPFICCPSIQ